MVGQVCLAAFSLCTVIIVIASPNGSNEGTITKLTQLEETVSDLQKHIVAQDQKQTAVLSNVLSSLAEARNKWTKTIEDFTKLQHNYTVLENELSSLKDNYFMFRKRFSRHEVAFEATMVTKGRQVHYRTFLENSTLIFPTIQYNEGGCWNPSTGVFTASVNGTYLFWIDLAFTGVHAFTLQMKRNDQNFGRAFGRLPNPTETTTISGASLTQLVEGNRVKFVTDKTVNIWPKASSCGGVLLHSTIQ